MFIRLYIFAVFLIFSLNQMEPTDRSASYDSIIPESMYDHKYLQMQHSDPNPKRKSGKKDEPGVTPAHIDRDSGHGTGNEGSDGSSYSSFHPRSSTRSNGGRSGSCSDATMSCNDEDDGEYDDFEIERSDYITAVASDEEHATTTNIPFGDIEAASPNDGEMPIPLPHNMIGEKQNPLYQSNVGGYSLLAKPTQAKSLYKDFKVRQREQRSSVSEEVRMQQHDFSGDSSLFQSDFSNAS